MRNVFIGFVKSAGYSTRALNESWKDFWTSSIILHEIACLVW